MKIPRITLYLLLAGALITLLFTYRPKDSGPGSLSYDSGRNVPRGDPAHDKAFTHSETQLGRSPAGIPAGTGQSEYTKRNLLMLGPLDDYQRAWAERAIPHLDNVARLKPSTRVRVETINGEVIVTFVPGGEQPPNRLGASYYAQVYFDAKTSQYKTLLIGS